MVASATVIQYLAARQHEFHLCRCSQLAWGIRIKARITAYPDVLLIDNTLKQPLPNRSGLLVRPNLRFVQTGTGVLIFIDDGPFSPLCATFSHLM